MSGFAVSFGDFYLEYWDFPCQLSEIFFRILGLFLKTLGDFFESLGDFCCHRRNFGEPPLGNHWECLPHKGIPSDRTAWFAGQ